MNCSIKMKNDVGYFCYFCNRIKNNSNNEKNKYFPLLVSFYIAGY